MFHFKDPSLVLSSLLQVSPPKIESVPTPLYVLYTVQCRYRDILGAGDQLSYL